MNVQIPNSSSHWKWPGPPQNVVVIWPLRWAVLSDCICYWPGSAQYIKTMGYLLVLLAGMASGVVAGAARRGAGSWRDLRGESRHRHVTTPRENKS